MPNYSTVNDELNRIDTNIKNAYISAQSLGATIPVTKNTDNLSSCLDTIDNYPFVPSRMNGLCFWLDGDCNTRNGLDRSKKYFENLMWNKPPITTTGNSEVLYAGTSSWSNNILKVGARSYYPWTCSEEFTLELVFKDYVDGYGVIKCQYDSTGYDLQFSNSHVFWCLTKKSVLDNATAGHHNDYYINAALKDSNFEVAHYAVAKLVRSSKYVSLFVPESNDFSEGTYSNIGTLGAAWMGFNGNGGTSTSDSTPFSDNIGIGMMRCWSRLLTDSEIQANYKDAKKRFGCI